MEDSPCCGVPHLHQGGEQVRPRLREVELCNVRRQQRELQRDLLDRLRQEHAFERRAHEGLLVLCNTGGGAASACERTSHARPASQARVVPPTLHLKPLLRAHGFAPAATDRVFGDDCGEQPHVLGHLRAGHGRLGPRRRALREGEGRRTCSCFTSVCCTMVIRLPTKPGVELVSHCCRAASAWTRASESSDTAAVMACRTVSQLTDSLAAAMTAEFQRVYCPKQLCGPS